MRPRREVSMGPWAWVGLGLGLLAALALVLAIASLPKDGSF